MQLPSLHTLQKLLKAPLLRLASVVILAVSVVVPAGVIYLFGFDQNEASLSLIRILYQDLLLAVWIALTLRIVLGRDETGERPPTKGAMRWVLRAAYLVLTAITLTNLAVRLGWIGSGWGSTTEEPWVVIVSLLLCSVIEWSRWLSNLLSRKVNPAALLASCFLLLILTGSFLLMLPNCTIGEIRYIDALFTSASAVCVTGLSTVSLPETFTLTGQIVLLFLIQVGGLGIMTITSFFGLFFLGHSSMQGQLLVGDLLSEKRLGSLPRTLIKIITVTLTIEAAGALLLFGFVDEGGVFGTSGESFFFAIFHSVSAFCNAGFSTLEGNLYDPAVRGLWGIPAVVSWLIIFGGIGFPIFSNLLSVAGNQLRNLGRRLIGRPAVRRPRLWNLTTYIVLRTTAVLIVVSWGAVLALEWNGALADFSLSGKLAQGFLTAVTPRTAGFNGVDMGRMLPATLLLTTLLMWIGGAPQSTAGGIKVTTAYMALKNIFSSIRGNTAIEVHHREIPTNTVRRAFTVIMVSILILVFGTLLLCLLEPGLSPGKLAFEAVSALGTVGLSLGITPLLGDDSKVVIILLMFFGRIGMLSLVATMVRRQVRHPYSYPYESILLN